MTNITRSIASKVYIKDINDGKFVRTDSRWEPNYVITPLKEKVSRVRVMATVVSKFIGEDQKYGSLTLDDGSDTITARAFRDEIALMQEAKPGDIVDVVGKVKEYEDEKYISLEYAKRIEDPNWELVRKLELLLKEAELGGREEVTKEELPQPMEAKVEEETVTEDPKIVILNLIEELDDGEGVKYISLLNEGGLDEDTLENVLNELMGDGEIYEPKIGRFRRV